MDKDGQRLVQSSSLPPAQPTYVFRGHTAQIHALHFFRQNLRLLSGDAHGWVVLWSMTIRRPVAVWKAHSNAILGLGSWKNDRIITFVVSRTCSSLMLMMVQTRQRQQTPCMAASRRRWERWILYHSTNRWCYIGQETAMASSQSHCQHTEFLLFRYVRVQAE